jgi:DNA-binding NarL/FixJ family response regulator
MRMITNSSQPGVSCRGVDRDACDRPVRVLIVDDHPAVRTGVAGVLAAEADLDPVAMVATAREAAAEARRLSPGVAIVDYRLPGRDGLSLTIELKRLPHPPGVLIYSAFADARLAVGAIVAGADSIVKKSSTGDELCAAVRSVARGVRARPEVPPETMTAIAAQLQPEDLSILGMLTNGVRPGEVAEALGMTDEWLAIRRWAILKRVIGSGKPSQSSAARDRQG